MSVSTIERDLAELEGIYTEQGAERIVEIQNRERIITWRGIEDAIASLQPLVDNPRTRIQALRRRKELWERKSKLLGLDMPSKHAHTDPTGQREYKGLDPELRRKILERARSNGDAPPTVSHEPVEP